MPRNPLQTGWADIFVLVMARNMIWQDAYSMAFLRLTICLFRHTTSSTKRQFGLERTRPAAISIFPRSSKSDDLIPWRPKFGREVVSGLGVSLYRRGDQLPLVCPTEKIEASRDADRFYRAQGRRLFSQIPFFSARTGKGSHPLFIGAEFGGRTFVDDASVVQHVGAVGNFNCGADILFDQQYRNALCSC